ncbi:hypothetical protein J5Y21_02095, partial [Corynebacterium sp. Marseille-P3884]|nr:hypothetical protein [Corynebacterium sp. Marseille-P3884]
VAFEELTSTVVDKTGQDNPKGGNTPDDYSDDNDIAEHKDINDDNQTVVSEETPGSGGDDNPGGGSSDGDNPGGGSSDGDNPGGGSSDGDGSSVDRSKLWWLLLIPGLGLIPALLGGGGSSTPAPGEDKPAPGEDKPAPGEDKPAPGEDKPAPGEDKPAPGEESSTSTVHTPKPVGEPVPADSPRGEIKQIPSGGTALDADMPTYI